MIREKYKIANSIITLMLFVLLISCTSKENELYQSGKVWYYDAEYRSNNKQFNYDIRMIPGGIFFLQQKIKWVVELPDSIKQGEFLFRSESTTGFIENKSKIWLHPPRTHEFKFITQLAPYPQIQFPLIIGDTIKGNITMTNNWGEWNGKSSNYHLVLIEKEYNSALKDTLWVLKGEGVLGKDRASATHWFSKSRGFVESIYENNSGEYFKMKLNKIE